MFDTFIGIDVSKDKFNFAIIDENLKPIQDGSLSMDLNGFQQLLNIIKKFNNPIVALESTGPYHINILSFLSANSIKTAIINPSLIKRFSSSISLRNTKTDVIDALVIAKFIAKNKENAHHFTQYNINDITALAKLREHISQEIAKIKTSLKQHLSVVFPEFLIEFNPFSDTALHILKLFPTTELIRKAGVDKIKQALQNMDSKHKAHIDPKHLYDMALNSIGQSSDIWANIVRHDVEILSFLNQKLDNITNDFIDKINQFKKDDMEILSSIKGISNITSAHFLSEIKDISRFQNSNKLSAYAGIDPSIKQSGSSINSKGKISKKGVKSLRRTIYLMSMGIMKFNHYFRNYYLKKRKQGMPHRKAMIALCNKLLRVIFALLTKKQHFIEPTTP